MRLMTISALGLVLLAGSPAGAEEAPATTTPEVSAAAAEPEAPAAAPAEASPAPTVAAEAPAPVEGTGEDAMAQAFNERMREMEEAMAKIRQTADPKERWRLMREQADKMREAMREAMRMAKATSPEAAQHGEGAWGPMGPGRVRGGPGGTPWQRGWGPRGPMGGPWGAPRGPRGPRWGEGSAAPGMPGRGALQEQRDARRAYMQEQMQMIRQRLDEQERMLDQLLEFRRPLEELLRKQGVEPPASQG